MLNTLHDIVTMTVIALIAYAIVSPRVPTGIMPTAGLGVIAFALIWSLDDWHRPDVTLNYITGGLGLVGWGMAWRLLRKRGCRMRRGSDWCATRPLRELDAGEQRQAAGGKGTR
jgi:hypothetical protein